MGGLKGKIYFCKEAPLFSVKKFVFASIEETLVKKGSALTDTALSVWIVRVTKQAVHWTVKRISLVSFALADWIVALTLYSPLEAFAAKRNGTVEL